MENTVTLDASIVISDTRVKLLSNPRGEGPQVNYTMVRKFACQLFLKPAKSSLSQASYSALKGV